MSNGWSGGQYSLFRLILGAYLFVHFVQLIPWGAELFSSEGVLPQASLSPVIYLFPNILAIWDSPSLIVLLLGAAALLSILLASGFWDRAAALALWYVWACLVGRNPLISNPSLPYVGWLLLAHVFVPSAPYGSLAALGRPDPGGSWKLPPGIFLAAWVLMALGYSYSGWTKLMSPSWLDGTALARVLENPLARPGFCREALLALPGAILASATWVALALELLFAPLACFRRLRPWLWGLMLLIHLALLAVVDFADLSLGMVMLHLFTFNPSWVASSRAMVSETIFYDGSCGLCHRAVRFVLAESTQEEAFRFAPLDSRAFRDALQQSGRSAPLPDSMIVQSEDGGLLERSAAVLFIMKRLGGIWRVIGGLVRFIPLKLRDTAYDGIAKIRYRLFKRPPGSCPIVPPHLRKRFDD